LEVTNVNATVPYRHTQRQSEVLIPRYVTRSQPNMSPTGYPFRETTAGGGAGGELMGGRRTLIASGGGDNE